MSELNELYRKICLAFSDILNAKTSDFLRFIIKSTGSKLIGDRIYWPMKEFQLWLCVDVRQNIIKAVNTPDDDFDASPMANILLASILSMRMIAITEKYSDILLESIESTSSKLNTDKIFSLVRHVLDSPFLSRILLETAISYTDNVLIWFIEEVGAYARIDIAKETIHLLLEPSDPLTGNRLANSFGANLLYEDLVRYIDSRLPQLHAPNNKIYFGPFSLS